MKYLVAGFGSIGRRHLRNLLALGEKDIVLLRSHKSTLDDDEIRDFPVETTIEASLSHHPDGVVVAVPTALHMDIAIPAAKAGCAILMEKPVADSPARLGELRGALEGNGGRLQMGFQYRFHPGLLKAKELMDSGAIGKPLSFRAEWGEYMPGWHPWEDYRKTYAARKDLGGGVLLTLSHPLDYCRWLFGDPEFIWGLNTKISDLEIDVDDIAEIGLAMKNGMAGSIHLDYYRRPVRNQLEVIGSEGTLKWTNDDALVVVESPDVVTQYPPKEGFERNWLFLDETRKFIEVTAGRSAPSCTLEDGIAAQKMVAMVRKSWETKRMLNYSEEMLLD